MANQAYQYVHKAHTEIQINPLLLQKPEFVLGEKADSYKKVKWKVNLFFNKKRIFPILPFLWILVIQRILIRYYNNTKDQFYFGNFLPCMCKSIERHLIRK